ncbi:MAG: Holliday junction resolvase RuvX [Burkholderiales bacterium]|nr:Holliday junction resolvase RuvX [Burkholderiales bacterium]
MIHRTALGIDFGLRRTGVAIGNTLTGGARPLETIDAPGNAERFARLADLIAQWQPDLLVVGLPVTASGGDSALAVRIRRFGRQLHGRFGLPVEFVDERYSSAVVQSALKTGRDDKAVLDAAAAAVILQAWLDQHT